VALGQHRVPSHPSPELPQRAAEAGERRREEGLRRLRRARRGSRTPSRSCRCRNAGHSIEQETYRHRVQSSMKRSRSFLT
jgi:hypothetical protein